MTAMATVLAFQVAVADDNRMMANNESSLSQGKQHQLAKTKSQAVKQNNSNNAYRTRLSVDGVLDFQVAIPDKSNKDRYKYASGNSFVKRLYKDDAGDSILVKDPSSLGTTDVVGLKADHDGGILGDYSKNYYYSTNALVNLKFEQAFSKNVCAGAMFQVLTPVKSDRLGSYSVGAKNKGAYLFVSLPYFQIQAGSMVGAEQMLKIDPAMWSAGDGGVTSGWINYVNLEGNYVDAVISNPLSASRRHRDVLRPFYVAPSLYSQYVSNVDTFARTDDTDISIAPKVAIYTNSFNGVQFGASYAPTQAHRDDDYKDLTQAPPYKNVIGVGAKYSVQVNDMLKLDAAGVVEIGDALQEKAVTAGDGTYYDLTAYSVGAMVRFANLNIGAEYGNLGKSGMRKSVIVDENLNRPPVGEGAGTSYRNNDSKDTYYMTTGGSYDIGPVRVSVNYFTSVKNGYSTRDVDDNILSDWNAGVDYNFTYGSKKTKYTLYAAGHYFTTEERIAISGVAANAPEVTTKEGNNSGELLMVGIKAIF